LRFRGGQVAASGFRGQRTPGVRVPSAPPFRASHPSSNRDLARKSETGQIMEIIRAANGGTLIGSPGKSGAKRRSAELVAVLDARLQVMSSALRWRTTARAALRVRVDDLYDSPACATKALLETGEVEASPLPARVLADTRGNGQQTAAAARTGLPSFTTRGPASPD
jgi:hypothetical protein